MLDRFDVWQYRKDANCWDYVREFLIERANIPSADLPKFGICPDDKRAMTRAGASVASNFTESEPVQFSIACHFVGGVLFHVGVVDRGIIRHTGHNTGTIKESFADFEGRAAKTVYMLHKKYGDTKNI